MKENNQGKELFQTIRRQNTNYANSTGLDLVLWVPCGGSVCVENGERFSWKELADGVMCVDRYGGS